MAGYDSLRYSSRKINGQYRVCIEDPPVLANHSWVIEDTPYQAYIIHFLVNDPAKHTDDKMAAYAVRTDVVKAMLQNGISTFDARLHSFSCEPIILVRTDPTDPMRVVHCQECCFHHYVIAKGTPETQ